MAQFQDGLRRPCFNVRGIPALPKLCRLDVARYAQFSSNFLPRCSRAPLKAKAQTSHKIAGLAQGSATCFSLTARSCSFVIFRNPYMFPSAFTDRSTLILPRSIEGLMKVSLSVGLLLFATDLYGLVLDLTAAVRFTKSSAVWRTTDWFYPRRWE